MLKPLLVLMVAGLVGGCAAAPAEQTEAAEQRRPGVDQHSCYQKAWWAETGPLLYRRFGEDAMPTPALMGDEPLSATAPPAECP